MSPEIPKPSRTGSHVPPLPTGAAVSPPSPAEPEDGEELVDETGGGLLLSMLRSSPSWLVSMVVHVLILIVLALVTIPLTSSRPEPFSVTGVSPDEVIEVEDIPFDMEPLPETALEAPVDPGMADLGEIAANVEDDMMAATAVIEPDEIGALFGDSGNGMSNVGDGTGATEFFGIKATGNRFVFIIDRSSSMRDGKFEVARRELMATVRRLRPEQKFYVIFFDKGSLPMFDAKNPEPRLLKATAENRARLGRWLQKVKLGGGTMPHESVKFAMGLSPDAIYILSDGAFNKGDQTVTYLKKENVIDDVAVDDGEYKVAVHAIGFHTQDDGTLEKLAKAYGGTYRFVTKPKTLTGLGKKK